MLRLLSLLGGPIFAKEMVEMARRKRYYFNRIFYGLALLLVLLPVYKNYSGQAGVVPSIKVMATMAEAMFHAVCGTQFAAVFLFVPIFLCGVIAAEREEQTLELLFTTHVTDREIILGKLISRLAVLMLLILCCLPIMSMIMLFGGIDPPSLWRMLAATLLAMFYAGAHAIYFSTITRSPMGALVRTYWWMALWILGVPAITVLLLMASLGRRPGPPPPFFFNALGCLPFVNPVGGFLLAFNPPWYNALAGRLGTWFFPFTFVLPSAWSVLLIIQSVRRLRLPPSPLASMLSKIPLVRRCRELWQRSARARARRRSFRPEKLGFIYTIKNPLWLRSRRVHAYDREGHLGRIQHGGWALAILFIVLMGIVEPRALHDREASMVYLAPTWIAVGLLAAVVSGSGLVGDRRRGFLDLVLITPLTSREIVDGSLLTAWQHLRRIYWLPVLLCLFFGLTGSVTWMCLFWSLANGTLFAVLMVVHGTASSLAARNMFSALIMTAIFPLLMIIGIVFLIFVFRHSCGPALLILSLLFFAVSRIWVRRQGRVVAVGCYLMSVHLLLLTLATCWTWNGGDEEFPVVAMHPAVLTIGVLEGRLESMFPPHAPWYLVLPGYAAAVALNIIYARWWLIRNFDRLAGRQGDQAKPRPSMLRRVAEGAFPQLGASTVPAVGNPD